VRRLQLYEQFKQAAHDLDDLPRHERDTFSAIAEMPDYTVQKQHPHRLVVGTSYAPSVFSFCNEILSAARGIVWIFKVTYPWVEPSILYPT
jgi:hypothetical protein